MDVYIQERSGQSNRYPVVLIQSRFDTSHFDTNQKSFRYKSKVVSIQIKSLKFNVKPRENASCVCYGVFN